MEKENHEKVFSIVTSIIRYLATFWAMLFYPKRTLAKINSTDLIRPGFFLLINIFLSLSFAQFIGYDIASFPISDPFLKRLTVTSFISFRFLVGLSIFLMLLKLFLKSENLKTFIKLVLPVLCYCSVLYVPIILVEHNYSNYVSEDLLNITSKVMAGLPTNLSIFTYFEFLLYLMIPLIFLIWWLRLLYLGINFLKLQSSIKIKRALVFLCLLFFIFQTMIASALFIKINSPNIQSFWIIVDQKVEKELSLNPPNYLKATVLSSTVAENQYMPDYVRYIYRLKQIISAVGCVKGNEKLISEGLRGLRDKNYDYPLCQYS